MSYTDHDYEPVARYLKVPTIQSVFETQQIIFIYKLVNGMMDSSTILSKISIYVPNIKLRNQENNQMFAYLEVNNNNNRYKNVSGVHKMCMTVNKYFPDLNIFGGRISTFKRDLGKIGEKYA